VDAQPDRELSRRLGQWAAWLMFLSMLTGGYAAFGMSGVLPIDGRIALAAHLTGLTGALWLIAVAWSLPFLSYSEVGKQRLCWLLILSQYANWLVTAGKAAWGVHGIAQTGETRNDLVYFVLLGTVVLPTLAAALAWAQGFRRR